MLVNTLKNWFFLTSICYRYEDQAALEFHAKSESVVETRRLLESEDLLSEPLKIMLTKDVGGYASKL